MLNWADFSGLVIIFAATLCGFGAAHAHKAGKISLVIFTVVGFVIGLGFAVASKKLAYSALRARGSVHGVYMIVPMLFIVAAFSLPWLIAMLIYGY
jgi:hypothetical protein